MNDAHMFLVVVALGIACVAIAFVALFPAMDCLWRWHRESVRETQARIEELQRRIDAPRSRR